MLKTLTQLAEDFQKHLKEADELIHLLRNTTEPESWMFDEADRLEAQKKELLRKYLICAPTEGAIQ